MRKGSRELSVYEPSSVLALNTISGISWHRNTNQVCNISSLLFPIPTDCSLDGSRQRPYDTVKPVADDLGLTVDISCDRDDPECVEDVVKDYNGAGNILIAWEHDALHDIVKELGAGKSAPDYPDDSFNIIWTDPSPYDKITSKTSENCPGLDN